MPKIISNQLEGSGTAGMTGLGSTFAGVGVGVTAAGTSATTSTGTGIPTTGLSPVTRGGMTVKPSRICAGPLAGVATGPGLERLDAEDAPVGVETVTGSDDEDDVTPLAPSVDDARSAERRPAGMAGADDGRCEDVELVRGAGFAARRDASRAEDVLLGSPQTTGKACGAGAASAGSSATAKASTSVMKEIPRRS